ncbi:response regulator [Spirillospora sp. CA-255316]
MDLRMPVMDGIEATRLIIAPGGARVLVLTAFDDDDHVFGALRAGATGVLVKDFLLKGFLVKGFLVKDMALDDILAAVRGRHRRGRRDRARRDPPVDRAVSPGAPPASHLPCPRGELDGVTGRERRAGRGHRTGARGADVGGARPDQTSKSPPSCTLGVATVKNYVTRLLTQLDSRDRVRLVIIAYGRAWSLPERVPETQSAPTSAPFASVR